MKRILLDQDLAPRVAALLRSEGWEALHVSEVDMDRADDPEILSFARDRGLTCITLDHDFHAHLAREISESPSVVLVRVKGLNADSQAELIRPCGKFARMPSPRERQFRQTAARFASADSR